MRHPSRLAAPAGPRALAWCAEAYRRLVALPVFKTGEAE
jgi:hypothetical protein